MAEDRGNSGPSIALIAVIAILVIAGLAIWFTTRDRAPGMMPDSNSTTIENRAGGATTSEPSTVERDTNVPDSVTIDTR